MLKYYMFIKVFKQEDCLIIRLTNKNIYIYFFTLVMIISNPYVLYKFYVSCLYYFLNIALS